MKNKFKCLSCGSTKLIVYKESVITRNYGIKADGTITKKVISLCEGDNSNPEGVLCQDCYDRFDYDTKDGKITEMYPKE
jgi:hypothetical protein